MRRTGAVLVLLAMASCINFDARIKACEAGGGLCAPDAAMGDDGGANDGGELDGGSGSDGGGGGFCFNGFCWVNPFPFGDDLSTITGTSASDVWVGGQAGRVAHWDGTAWEDRRLDAVSSVESLLAVGPDVLLVGEGVRPHRWDGGWVPETYRTEASTAGDIRYLYELHVVQGQVMTGGTRGSVGTVLAVRDAGVWTELNWVFQGEMLTAFSDGPTPLFATWDYADVRVRDLDGGVRLTFSSPGRELAAIWEEPGVGLWGAGLGDQIFQLSALDAGPNLFQGGPTTFFGGGWVPGVGNVATGTYRTIAEGGTTGLSVPLVIEPPGYAENYDAVWGSPDGGLVLVVGQGGALVQRQPDGTWAAPALGTRMVTHARINAATLTDGGVLLAGAGSSLTLRHAGELTVLRAASTPSPHRSVWADDTTIWTGSTYGELCSTRWDAPEAPTCTTFGTGWINGLAGATEATLFLAGTGGLILERDGGNWSAVAGPNTDLTCALATGTRRLVADSVGQVSEYSGAAGAFVPIYTTDAGLNALAVAPNGDLFAVGDFDLAITWSSASGWRSQRLTPLRSAALLAVCAFAPDDAWAVGEEGIAAHWNGSTWTSVVTGTQQMLTSVVCLQNGAQRTLVIGGDWGTVMEKIVAP